MFLEEDHYVAQDFLHVLSLMLAQKHKYNVDILSLGTYLKKAAVKTNNRQVNFLTFTAEIIILPQVLLSNIISF